MALSRKRGAKTNAWLARHNNDPFVKKARQDGFRARAAYKLEEIDTKYRLIKPKQRVIDLGAAPGSWCQYVVRKQQGKGLIVGVDLLEMPAIDGVHLIQADFTEVETQAEVLKLMESQPADLVLSDMAPNISGIALHDQARYERLLEAVLWFCADHLRPGGNLVTKFFEGESAETIRRQMKQMFQSLKTIKPDASRAHSRELYLLAQNLKPNAKAAIAREHSV